MTREKMIDLGPLQAMADTTQTIPLMPIVMGLALIGDVALLISGASRV